MNERHSMGSKRSTDSLNTRCKDGLHFDNGGTGIVRTGPAENDVVMFWLSYDRH